MSAQAGGAMPKPVPAATERRERKSVSMPGFAALPDGTTADVLIVNLTYDGCGIETPVALEPGTAIKLSVRRRGAIAADVRWYKDGKAGLVFHAEEPAKVHRPRGAERITLMAEVRLRRIGNASYHVRLFDLSPSGCKIELVERPRTGETLLVNLGELEPLQAEVCWVEEFVAGLRFARPIHPAVFDLLLAKLRG